MLFPLKIVYIDANKHDQAAFQRNVVGHSELSKVFNFEVVFFNSIQKAYQWLRTRPPIQFEQIDCVIVDPHTAVGDRSLADPAAQRLLDEALRLIQDIGFDKTQVIALPDSRDSDVVWGALKSRLGNEQVVEKSGAIAAGSLNALTDRLEEIVSKRSLGSGQAMQFSVIRLEARLEAIQERLDGNSTGSRAEDRRLEKRVEELSKEIRIISQTLFQGPNTQTPAIITELTEMKRYALGLNRDIGSLADAHKERLIHLEDEQKALRATLSSKNDRLTEFENQRKLKREDYMFKVLLVALGAGAAFLLSLATSVPIKDLLESLLKALTQ
jgi:hypothetical protein